MSSNTTVTIDDNSLSSTYNYVPTESTGIIFLTLFSISTLLHLAAAAWFRIWWLFPTAGLAGIGEVIGWIGRTWSSRNALDQTPYLMQIVCTIIAPTPLLGANFIIFSRIIRRLGSPYSRLTPKWYARVFLACDFIALIIQAAGGGIAADAKTVADQNSGGHIMLGGIVFQLVALLFFIALATEFYIRFFKNWPLRQADSLITATNASPFTLKLRLQSGGLAFSSVVILIRSIYRTIELSDGWSGRIISTQVYFNVLDGMMIVLAMYTLNILHPGFLLAEEAPVADAEHNENKTSSDVQSSVGPVKA